jgi:hemerythrin-like domain-containing protein
MNKKYTTILIEDHSALRDLMEKLKSSRLEDEKREEALALFIDLLKSHTVAEEKTLYNVRINNEWLRPDILEGLQEHREAEELIVKISHTTERDHRDAKIKVLCDYVKHHLDEEEETLFPHFEKTISDHQAEELAIEYVRIRGETQAHPTKISEGALKS